MKQKVASSLILAAANLLLLPLLRRHRNRNFPARSTATRICRAPILSAH